MKLSSFAGQFVGGGWMKDQLAAVRMILAAPNDPFWSNNKGCWICGADPTPTPFFSGNAPVKFCRTHKDIALNIP